MPACTPFPPRPPIPLIPVLDLRAGQVVRAVRGERAAYRPLADSALGAGPEPLDTARRLLASTGGQRLYVADLDALQGGAVQTAVLRRLMDARPDLALWLDAGLTDRAAAEALAATLGRPLAEGDPLGPPTAGLWPVFASESLRDAAALEALFDTPARRAAGLLSLDRRGGQALDPAGAWTRPAAWPDTVIVMTLERVGSGEGPALDALSALRRRAPAVRWVGAGGLRGPADRAAAGAAGASAWLVASALHAGAWAAGPGPASGAP